ncbi:hypothetical protein BRM3_02205 [Brachybacterium huguangmaarense]|uniref:Polysaccharide biosynthesis protein n=1 Tax=Brachybacterium huguangmaarense TaxID=1652028 RepID=A0ABY6G243_9MICO|nr:oligosaccharide flippase family protein [Brachybacterium huguangmaarense]UYG17270.1 hypothetical protein BRM3_02205 [Brachybacterium huguangmaarense]
MSIVLLPLYSRLLSADSFGRANVALSIAAVLGSVVFVEIWTAVLRATIARHRDRAQSESTFVTSAAFCVLALPILGVTVFLSDYFLKTGLAKPTFVYGAMFAFCSLWQNYVRGLGDALYFVISGVLASLTQLAIAVAAVLGDFRDPAIMLLSPTGGYIIGWVFLEAKFRLLRNFGRLIVPRELREILSFATPLALSAAAYWALSQFSTVYVALVGGYAQSGLVSAATRYTSLLVFASAIFTAAWQESAYERSGREGREVYFENALLKYVRVSGLLGGLFLLATPLLYRVMLGSALADGAQLAPMYACAALVAGIGTFLAQIYAAEGRTLWTFLSTLFGGATSVVVLLTAYPVLGLFAAPLSLLLGQLITAALRMLFLRRVILVGFPLRDFVGVSLWVAVCAGLASARLEPLWFALLVVLGICASLLIFRRECVSTCAMFRGRRSGAGR